ncbi:hypothetical protein ACFFGH_28215 [Lysobacter korlensis]|uniref:Excalibur calcium-binding domain-containing protein n=1 Tax=Lysobacter korlensis TaxID=553636 RepID=A0ABV6RXM4_9GAMM
MKKFWASALTAVLSGAGLVATASPAAAAEVAAVVSGACVDGANETTVSLTNDEATDVLFVLTFTRDGVPDAGEMPVAAGVSDAYSTSFPEDSSTRVTVTVGDGPQAQVVADETIEVNCEPDVPLHEATAPTVTGLPAPGATLTAVPGEWLPSGVVFAYQWMRDEIDIPGADDATYIVAESDRGTTLTVRLTGTLPGFITESRTSTGTAIPEVFTTAPLPTITGLAAVGTVLLADAGTWVPAADSLTYQWFRDATPIPGANASTYVLTGADAGFAIKVHVTGAKAGFESVTASSVATLRVLSAGAPAISGGKDVGKVLTVTPGTWGPSPVTLSYQWLRNGSAISGANAATYKLGSSDAGRSVSVRVTGSKGGFPSVAKTSPAVAVNGILTAKTPTISGTGAVGKTLTASAGTWGPSPVTLKYQWYRNGAAISGAVAKTYRLVTADAGRSITVKVTGSKSGYTSASRTSSAKIVLKLLKTATPRISGTAKAGQTLTVLRGTWGPTPVTLKTQWYRNGVAISGATGSSLKLTTKDAGKSITVKVTGSKSGYSTVSKTSAAKTVYKPARPADVDCNDFGGNWSAAQAWYKKYYPYYGDVADLDRDNDGIACDSLR